MQQYFIKAYQNDIVDTMNITKNITKKIEVFEIPKNDSRLPQTNDQSIIEETEERIKKLKENDSKLEEFKLTEYVSIIVTNYEGKLWTAQRINKKKPLYGKQCVPGGKIEDQDYNALFKGQIIRKESPLKEACIRELNEEIGLRPKSPTLIHYIKTDIYTKNQDGYEDTI